MTTYIKLLSLDIQFLIYYSTWLTKIDIHQQVGSMGQQALYLGYRRVYLISICYTSVLFEHFLGKVLLKHIF